MAVDAGSARPPLWRDVRARRIAIQAGVALAVVGLGAFLLLNLNANLSRQGIPTDYSYLNRPTRFAIPDSNFDSSQPVREAMLVGIKNTAIVALSGILLALLVGVLVGIARLSRNWLVSRAASIYVEVLRNVPVLVVILFIYTGLILQLPAIADARVFLGGFILSNTGGAIPSLERTAAVLPFVVAVSISALAALGVAVWRTRRFDRTGAPHHRVASAAAVLAAGIIVGFLVTGRPLALSLPEPGRFAISGGLTLNPEFAALLAGLVVYTASHIAEIVRGSIQAIAKGQSEAATALGLSEFQRLRYVVLPQAFRIMIPPLANQFLNLTKNSSLAVFIGYPEITRITGIIVGQGNPAPQAISLLMAIYLFFSLSISAVTNLINRRLSLATR